MGGEEDLTNLLTDWHWTMSRGWQASSFIVETEPGRLPRSAPALTLALLNQLGEKGIPAGGPFNPHPAAPRLSPICTDWTRVRLNECEAERTESAELHEFLRSTQRPSREYTNDLPGLARDLRHEAWRCVCDA